MASWYWGPTTGSTSATAVRRKSQVGVLAPTQRPHEAPVASTPVKGSRSSHPSTPPSSTAAIPQTFQHVLLALVSSVRSQLMPEKMSPFRGASGAVFSTAHPDSLKREHPDSYAKPKSAAGVGKRRPKQMYPFDRKPVKSPSRAEPRRRFKGRGLQWSEMQRLEAEHKRQRSEHVVGVLQNEIARDVSREQALLLAAPGHEALVAARIAKERAEAADWTMRLLQEYNLVSGVVIADYLKAVIAESEKMLESGGATEKTFSVSSPPPATPGGTDAVRWPADAPKDLLFDPSSPPTVSRGSSARRSPASGRSPLSTGRSPQAKHRTPNVTKRRLALPPTHSPTTPTAARLTSTSAPAPSTAPTPGRSPPRDATTTPSPVVAARSPATSAGGSSTAFKGGVFWSSPRLNTRHLSARMSSRSPTADVRMLVPPAHKDESDTSSSQAASPSGSRARVLGRSGWPEEAAMTAVTDELWVAPPVDGTLREPMKSPLVTAPPIVGGAYTNLWEHPNPLPRHERAATRPPRRKR